MFNIGELTVEDHYNLVTQKEQVEVMDLKRENMQLK